MQFRIKGYKKKVFETALRSFADENGFEANMPSFDSDSSDIIIATVSDTIIDKLNREQLEELLTIR